MASISVKNIVKNYGDVKVVKNINLEIQDGEFVVLVGPSGCGKSTTLRMIAGLEAPTSGEIHIGERDVTNVEPQHRNIAMVFQNYALYPHKTVRENIVFALRRMKVAEEEIQQKLDRVSKMLKIEEYLDRKPSDLSGGQRQRVAMGRAIIRDADCFLFDEPLSNLDAKLRNHMRTEIGQIHEEMQRTSVYVTHDQVEAMTLADRVVVMRDGIIEQVGTPMEIFLDPVNTFVATFIGSPAMNLIEATIDNNYLTIGDFKLPTAKLTNFKTEFNSDQPQEVIVGIRPDFFNDSSFFAPSESDFVFEGVDVDLIEPMGFDKEILFSLDQQKVKARLDLRTELKRGDKVNLVVDMSRIIMFDPNTQERI